MRPQRWTAASVPALCRRLSADANAEAFYSDIQEMRSLYDQDLVEATMTHVQMMGALADGLADAGLYWVRPAMMELAMQASHDVPRVVLAQAIEPEGFLLLERPLPPLPLPDVPQRRQFRPSGFVWHRYGLGILVHVLARAGEGITVWPVQHELVPATAIRLDPPGQELSDAPQDLLIAWLMSAWTLMVEPTLVEARTLTAESLGDGGARYPDHRHVTLVDLRRIERRPAETAGVGHQLKHRFMVRGHWRQQYHPSDRSHRLRWIAPYMKGPNGAPILVTDQVMVWKR